MADKQITEHKKQAGLNICACKTSSLNMQKKEQHCAAITLLGGNDPTFIFFLSLISQNCFNENQTSIVLMKK